MPASAENWIRIRESLLTDPRVDRIAEILGEGDMGDLLAQASTTTLRGVYRDAYRGVAVIALLRVWCVANRHTVDGVFQNATRHYLDDIAKVAGFGRAMETVGWAAWDAEARTFTLPDFTNWNSPAKGQSRSTKTVRQARWRALKALREASPTSPDLEALVEKARSVGVPEGDLNDALETLRETPTEASTETPTRKAEIELEVELKSTQTHTQPQVTREAPPAASASANFGTPPKDWPKTPEAARAMAGEIGCNPDDIEAIWSEHEGRGDFSETDAHGRAFPIRTARHYFRSRGLRTANKRAASTAKGTSTRSGTIPADPEAVRRRVYAQREEAREELAKLRRQTFTDESKRLAAAKRITELEARIESLNAHLEQP